MKCEEIFEKIFYASLIVIILVKSPSLFWTLQEITLVVYEIFCKFFYYGPMLFVHFYYYMYYYVIVCVFCFMSYKCFQFFNALFDAIKATVDSIKETVETIKEKVVAIEAIIKTQNVD